MGLLLDEYDGIGGDTLLATREAQFLRGRGLDGDIIDITAADGCHTLLHLGDMGIHLRTLSTDGGVDIHQMITLGGYQFYGLLQDDLTVHAVGKFCGIGEVVADVAHIRSAQQGITDGVQQHVGIAMAQQALTVIDLDAAHPQVAALYQLMDIVAHSYSYLHCFYFRMFHILNF